MNDTPKEEDAIPIKESATIDSKAAEYKNFEEVETKLVEEEDTKIDEKVGEIVGGHYEIIKPIAEGGMSAVYLARHQLLDQNVALKFILPSLIHDKNTTQRFQSEAKAASLLQHQNIASVREFGIDDTKRPFIVMEYVAGKTLEEWLNDDNTKNTTKTIDLLIQLCDGLAYAHQNNVIHRDLKPANLIIVDDPKYGEILKIVDFGIAKVLRDDDSGPDLTKTGDIFGTPKYMSPEQCLGKSVDIRADIYSVGCILYECLTGNPPFISNSMLEIMMMHVQDNVSFDTELLSDSLIHVISKCMEKDPTKRYQNIGDLSRDLSLIKESKQPINFDSSKISSINPQSSKQAIDSSLIKKSLPSEKTAKNRLVFAISFVLVLLGTVFFFISNRQPQFLNQLANSVSGSKINTLENQGNNALNKGDYNQALIKYSRAYEIFTNDKTKRDNVDYAKKQLEGLNRILLVTQITNNEKLGLKTRQGIKSVQKREASKNPSDFNALLKVFEVLDRTDKNKTQFDELSSKLLDIARTRSQKFQYTESIKLLLVIIPKLESAHKTDHNRLTEAKLLLAESLARSSLMQKNFKSSASDKHRVKSYLRSIKADKESFSTLAKSKLYLAYFCSNKNELAELQNSYSSAIDFEAKAKSKFSPKDKFVQAAVLKSLNERKEAKNLLKEIIPKLTESHQQTSATAATQYLISMLLEDLEFDSAESYLKQRIDVVERSGSNKKMLSHYYMNLGWLYGNKSFKQLSQKTTLEKGDKDLTKLPSYKNAEKYYLKSLELLQQNSPESWLDPAVITKLVSLYNSAGKKRESIVFLRQWIALNELYKDKYDISPDKSRLAFLLLSTGTKADKSEAEKIFNNNIEYIYSLPGQHILTEDTWLVDLADTFLVSKDERKKLLRRIENSAKEARTKYKNSKSEAYAKTLIKQLNMLSKAQFLLGNKKNAMKTLEESANFARSGPLSNFYREQALIKYAQVLKMTGQMEKSKSIWKEIKQLKNSSNIKGPFD